MSLRVWLVVDIALVLLGLVLVGLSGFDAWSRFRRMGRAGSRLARRTAELGAEAGDVSERVGALEDDTRRQTVRLQQLGTESRA